MLEKAEEKKKAIESLEDKVKILEKKSTLIEKKTSVAETERERIRVECLNGLTLVKDREQALAYLKCKDKDLEFELSFIEKSSPQSCQK